MKKQLLMAGFLLAGIFSVNAQETILLDENFNEITQWPMAEWVQHNVDGKTPNPNLGPIAAAFTATAPWGIISFNNDPTNAFLASTSYFSTAGQANRWIVSPAIDLSSMTTGSVTLTFTSMSAGETDLDSYALFVSTTGTAVSNFDTTPIHQETAVSSAGWSVQTVDLSSYLGQTIHLGWQHNANDKLILLIDDIKVVHNGSASVDDHLSQQFAMYPNPTTGIVNITNNENVLVSQVNVTDLNGRVVKTVKFDNVSEAQVDISGLSAGMYIMNITTNQGIATKKVVKK